MTQTPTWRRLRLIGAAGVALLVMAAAPSQRVAAAGPSLCDTTIGNLVQNCGFESGTFAHWSLSGNTGFISIVQSPVHSGNYAASFGAVGTPTVLEQQTLAGTTPSTTYSETFYLRNDGGTPNSFQADILNTASGTTSCFAQTDMPGTTVFVAHTCTFTTDAAGTAPTIRFQFRQDPAFFQLDDVIVVAQGGDSGGGPGTDTPELGSGELFAAGVLPILGVLFYRRRAARRAL